MTLSLAIKSWLEQLGPDGDFIPISTIQDENEFKPMYLVVKKKQKYSGKKTYTYHKTGIKLQDLLLSGDHAAELGESKTFTLLNETHGKGKGSLGIGDGPTSVEMGTSVSKSHVRNVTVKKKHITSEYLSSVYEDGKARMDHYFITKSKQSQRNLHVITEIIETVEKTQCEESKEITGSFTAKVSAVLKAFFHIGVEGGKTQKRAIEIPKDCTLAFRSCKLYIGNGYLYISDSEDSSDIGTLDAEIIIRTENGKTYKELVLPPCLKDACTRLFISTTYHLEEDIKEQCAQLFLLSAHLSGRFLTGFVAVMRENDLLQELKLQLEQALEGLDQFRLRTDHPELQELGKNLQDSNGALVTSLAEPTVYFLQALDDLTEFQLVLLADSVKKGILSKQLALVKSMLDGEMNFTVDAQLASQFAEEDLNITGAMIEASGVILQGKNPTLVDAGDQDVFFGLKALYVTLYILNRLYLTSQQHQLAHPASTSSGPSTTSQSR
ncbi:gasdermin-A-like [Tiliqua scincoides]|uniref:gasdermin-A-like n=1 Tax=Tiliqua scincoides TaxID=71010 RepID=UPI0034624FAA